MQALSKTARRSTALLSGLASASASKNVVAALPSLVPSGVVPSFRQSSSSLTNTLKGMQGSSANARSEQEVIVRLLSGLGSQKEVRQYLKLFSSVKQTQFAIIKIGGGVLDSDLEQTASTLAFLQRIGLFPIIIHGAGGQLTAELKAAGVQPEYIEGLRVTDAKTLEIASRVFQRENLKLVDALERLGVRARPVSGVFTCDYHNKPVYHFVGDVTDINTEGIASAIASGHLPVISSIGQSLGGQLMNINADVAALELAKRVVPLKIIFLNVTAGMADGEGKLIPQIQLDEDFDHLMAQPWCKYGFRLKIKEFKNCLDALPPSSSISITSPAHLAEELFTHKGHGTLVSKGERVQTFDGSALTSGEIDMPRLRELIESSFGRPLMPGYLESLSKKIVKIYLTSSYRACAILTREEGAPANVPYLDKFAVTEKAQGEGLADTIWKRMNADHPSLFWRSRSDNKVNSWYFDRATGHHRAEPWTVFWYGLNQYKDVEQSVATALALPATLLAEGASVSQAAPAAADVSQHVTGADKKFKIGIMGARGYVGNQVIRLLSQHPQLELSIASSSTQAGQLVSDVCPGVPLPRPDMKFTDLKPETAPDADIDAWFLALPDGVSDPYVKSFDAAAAKIKASGSKNYPALIDLSADRRFDRSWTYGLPETGNRAALQGTRRVANPGCYATGAQVALYPLVKAGLLEGTPSVFGVSGYSGAGTKPSEKNNLTRLSDNMLPYKLTQHMHQREVSFQLNHPIFFTPHVASWFQGITLTISAQLTRKVTDAELKDLFRATYAGEPLVKVVDDIPEVKDNSQKHHVTVGGWGVSPDGRHVVLVATLDNLLKGAATQALQNTNLALGLNELLGLGVRSD